MVMCNFICFVRACVEAGASRLFGSLDAFWCKLAHISWGTKAVLYLFSKNHAPACIQLVHIVTRAMFCRGYRTLHLTHRKPPVLDIRAMGKETPMMQDSRYCNSSNHPQPVPRRLPFTPRPYSSKAITFAHPITTRTPPATPPNSPSKPSTSPLSSATQTPSR